MSLIEEDDEMTVKTAITRGSKTSWKDIEADFSVHAFVTVLATQLRQEVAKMFQQKIKKRKGKSPKSQNQLAEYMSNSMGLIAN